MLPFLNQIENNYVIRREFYCILQTSVDTEMAQGRLMILL